MEVQDILASGDVIKITILVLFGIVSIFWSVILYLLIYVKNSLIKEVLSLRDKVNETEKYILSGNVQNSDGYTRLMDSLLLLKDSFRKHVHDTNTHLNRISILENEIEDIKKEIIELKESLCGHG